MTEEPFQEVFVVLHQWVEAHWVQAGLLGLLIGPLVYALALSIPFFPGVELGVLMMIAFKQQGIVFVYVATIMGLSVAYWIGRWTVVASPRVQSLKSS